MKKIKKLYFDITQSRRIKNYAEKHKITEKSILEEFTRVMDIIYRGWKNAYPDSDDETFEEYLKMVLKWAEFSFRLRERKSDTIRIKEHLTILQDAIEEYDTDYNKLIEIEKVLKDRGISWN